jgi:predicted peptidase
METSPQVRSRTLVPSGMQAAENRLAQRSMTRAGAVAFLGLALSSAAFAQSPARGEGDIAPQHQAMSFDAAVTQELHLEYLLALPEGYAGDTDRWPVILFLHGAGERGSDLALVETHGPPKLIAAGEKIPAIVVSPQCPANEWWTEDAHLLALERLLDEIVAKYRVDEDRIYVTGISMGGYGTWALASRQPERFAAAVPICGGGNALPASRLLRNLPIWAFHGDADPVVPVVESQRMVDAIRRVGGTMATITIYPGVGHDSWTQAYEDEALWEWLFAQRRAQTAPAAGSRAD